jgi:hypothetical protein
MFFKPINNKKALKPFVLALRDQHSPVFDSMGNYILSKLQNKNIAEKKHEEIFQKLTEAYKDLKPIRIKRKLFLAQQTKISLFRLSRKMRWQFENDLPKLRSEFTVFDELTKAAQTRVLKKTYSQLINQTIKKFLEEIIKLNLEEILKNLAPQSLLSPK